MLRQLDRELRACLFAPADTDSTIETAGTAAVTATRDLAADGPANDDTPKSGGATGAASRSDESKPNDTDDLARAPR